MEKIFDIISAISGFLGKIGKWIILTGATVVTIVIVLRTYKLEQLGDWIFFFWAIIMYGFYLFMFFRTEKERKKARDFKKKFENGDL